jgi:hypothetical protein
MRKCFTSFVSRAASAAVTIVVIAGSARAQNDPSIDSSSGGPYITDARRAQEAGYTFRATADRPDAVYHAGDPVRFTLQLVDKDRKPVDTEIKWTVSRDQMNSRGATTRPSADGTFTVDGGTLTEPGFVQFEATWTPPGASRMLQARAAAAFDREQIKPSMPAPDDFDAFWSDQRAKLAAVPMNVRMTPVKSRDAAVEVFDVQADVGDGAVMSGYLARPVGAKPKSLPAIVFGHGAGVARLAHGHRDGVREVRLARDRLQCPRHPNGQPPDFYAKLRTGELRTTRRAGRNRATRSTSAPCSSACSVRLTC